MDKKSQRYTEFDATDIYKEKLEPMIIEMKKICKINKIPFFFSIAYKNDQNSTTYHNDGVLPGSNFVDLVDDKFRKYLMVLNGAKVGFIDDDQGIQDYIENNLDE